MRLIDADVLYDKAVKWEAQAIVALMEVGSDMPFEAMKDVDKIEWLRLTAIFNERTAFKFDVADAPTIDAVEVVRCKDCKHLSNDRIAPEWQRICRWLGVGKSDDGYCDEAKRREDA